MTWILLFIVFVIKCKYVLLISEMAEFSISDGFPLETEGESNLPLEECNITKTERTQDPDMWTSDPLNFVTETSPGHVIGASPSEAGRPLQMAPNVGLELIFLMLQVDLMVKFLN